MSLIIALYMGEGIVMASDSRTTYNTTETTPSGVVTHNNGVHFSDSTYKTFLTPNGVGISTCGDAGINDKPIAGFIESFINEHKNNNVDEIKDSIIPYFKNLCPTIDTHFFVGGYINSGTSYDQKLYHIKTKTENIRTLNTSKQGATWDGEIDVLSRILTPLFANNNSTYIPLP